MAERVKYIDAEHEVEDGDDTWFWEGYLKDEEDEPEWVKEALEDE